jgi:hypothetical protein
VYGEPLWNGIDMGKPLIRLPESLAVLLVELSSSKAGGLAKEMNNLAFEVACLC